MAYSAKILLDSIGPCGVRLTTFEVTYPRMVHADCLRHRVLSRSVGSTRAIPIEKMIERAVVDPVLPVWWGKNQKGMVAAEELEEADKQLALAEWIAGRDDAVRHVTRLKDIGLHKQLANRILEPWLWITEIITATEWSNFFALRDHADAQPELRHVVAEMRRAYAESKPKIVRAGEWHMPLLPDLQQLEADDYNMDELKEISAGRCARASYLTHHGTRDPMADLDLYDRMIREQHMSPLEHVAQALEAPYMVGNFCGWRQLRKSVPNEDDFGRALAERNAK